MHQPVLLNEVLDHWLTDSEGLYVDATFGRGGHSRALLDRLGKNARLVAIDQDLAAIEAAGVSIQDKRFSIIHGSFADIATIAEKTGIAGQITGLLLDIGVSSPQLDNPERGFSFLHDGPLDMRMNQSASLDARKWVNQTREADMVRMFKEYGEERFAKRIASAICNARKEKEITRTKELADIVAKANPKWEKHKHPATRVFQAIRIAVNDELGALETALVQCIDMIKPGGRILVISFHSLEDRIVKHFFRDQAKGKAIPKGLPVTDAFLEKKLKLVSRAIKPTEEEIKTNPRARSAVLRVAEKL